MNSANSIRYFIFLIILFLAFTPTASLRAAENTFQIQIQIIGDEVNPTAPTNLSGLAVSTSQIDLSWTASTDDVGVTGYKVFRDGVQVATSTGTSYSDTGLVSSTNYSYTVQAFDAAGNLSELSNTAVVKTQAPTNSIISSGAVFPVVFNLRVVSTQHESIITWQTTQYTQTNVVWGKTSDYELGSLVNNYFLVSHEARIPNLEAGKTYQAKIESVNGEGRKTVTSNIELRTLPEIDTEPPANVTDLQASLKESKVILTWNNPEDADFDSVRVVRSELFYPRDIVDGKIIYEGSGEKITDGDVVPGKTYYYTVFARDANGNYSSGTITQIRFAKDGTIEKAPDQFPKAPTSTIPAAIQKITLADFEFYQGGKRIPVIDGVVKIDGRMNLKILIQYERLPEVLKTIVLNLEDSEDKGKTFSFLLRVNKSKTAYEAIVGPLEREAIFPLSIVILDYKNQEMKGLTASVISSLSPSGSLAENGRGDYKKEYLLLLILLLICLVAYLTARAVRSLIEKRKEKKEETQAPSNA